MTQNCYVQYHNCKAMGRWPRYEMGKGPQADWGGFFTKKNMILVGEKVYLIAGIKSAGKKMNDYYLTGYTLVKEIYYDDGVYSMVGPEFLRKEPLLLNGLDGFEHYLRKTVNNFSLGLQNTCNDPFSAIITDESQYVPMAEAVDSYNNWLEEFENQTQDSADSQKLGCAPEFVCKHVWDFLVDLASQKITASYDDLRNYVNPRTGKSYLCRGTAVLLRPIQNFCIERDFPPLTALIVNKGSEAPGKGYDPRGITFVQALKRVYEYPWKSMDNPYVDFATEKDSVKSFARRILKVPTEAKDVYGRIKVRGVAQQVFREILLDAYKGKCAICNHGATAILQAAHIKPWGECTFEESYDVTNGILLCPNHHSLWDKGLIDVTEDYVVECEDKVERNLDGRKLTLPKDVKLWPSKKLLKWRIKKDV